MTIHPIAVVATIIVLGLATLTTWLIQRSRRQRGRTAENEFAQWQALFWGSSVLLGVAAWLLLSATGLLRH